MKSCRRCGELKPAEAFPPHKATRDRLGSWCRSCQSAYGKAWRKARPGYMAARGKAARARQKGAGAGRS